MSVTRPTLSPSPAVPPVPVGAAVVSAAVVAARRGLVVAAAAADREQKHEQRCQANEPHTGSDTGRGGIETPPLPWNRVLPSPWSAGGACGMFLIFPAASSLRTASTCAFSCGEMRGEIFP